MSDSPVICTLVLSYEYPHDTQALYGPDGEYLDDADGLSVAARVVYGCDMLRLVTVWDGAIMRSIPSDYYGTTEWNYEWPDELGDWLNTPIPDEAREESAHHDTPGGY